MSPSSYLDQFIYIMINPAMQGLLKIGKTNRTPTERAQEISGSTGVPTKFHVAYELRVKDSTRAERLIHEKLMDYRVEMNREFFFLPLDRAISIISNIVSYHDLEAEDIKVHPYKFNFRFFSEPSEFCSEIINSIENWEQAKLHFSEGFITDWLKKKKEYDALINLDNAKKENTSEAFLLSVVVHSILPNSCCRFASIALDDISFISQFLQHEKQYKEAILFGEINNFYRGFLFSKRKAEDSIIKTLYFISENGENDSFESKLSKIFKLIEWLTSEVYPYRGSLSYEQITLLVKESDFKVLQEEYIIPESIREMFFSKNEHFEACKILRPNNKSFENEFLTKKEYEYYLKNYFSSSAILDDIENYAENKAVVKIIKEIIEKYPPKDVLYKEYYFHQVFEFDLINGEEIPLVKIIEKETIEQYFIPKFLLDGLISPEPRIFSFSAKIWSFLQTEYRNNIFLVHQLYFLFFQAQDIESIKTPDSIKLKTFIEENSENHVFGGIIHTLIPEDPESIKVFLEKLKENSYSSIYSRNDYSDEEYIKLWLNQITSISSLLIEEFSKPNIKLKLFFELLAYIYFRQIINDNTDKFLIKDKVIKDIQFRLNDKEIHFNVEIMNKIKSLDLTNLLFQNCLVNLKSMDELGENYNLPFEIYTKLISNDFYTFFSGLRKLFLGLGNKAYSINIIKQYLLLESENIEISDIDKRRSHLLISGALNNIRNNLS
jgi:hypothetical protein